MMPGVESDLHERRVRAGIGRINRGETRLHADVGNDDFQIVGGHSLADNLFHLLHQLIGEFEARAGCGFDIDNELAGIGARKICFADEWIQREAQNKNARDAEHRGERS